MLCQGAELYDNNVCGFGRVTSRSIWRIVYLAYQQHTYV